MAVMYINSEQCEYIVHYWEVMKHSHQCNFGEWIDNDPVVKPGKVLYENLDGEYLEESFDFAMLSHG